tara:strand:- start:4296 stop:4856 length:561 start_codon:yes stop_codon:yes gene_type:complete
LKKNPDSGDGLPLPQLEMLRADFKNLPEIAVPQGYGLRSYKDGDEAAWCAIMEGNIGIGWTIEKCRERLIYDSRFDREGLFFATFNREPVGSACAWRKAIEEKRVGEVHMVAIHEAHRRKLLGYMLNVAVLHRLKETGFKVAHLQTDDWRLAAIKCYLSVGFEPLNTHQSHAMRWDIIIEKLSIRD